MSQVSKILMLVCLISLAANAYVLCDATIFRVKSIPIKSVTSKVLPADKLPTATIAKPKIAIPIAASATPAIPVE